MKRRLVLVRDPPAFERLGKVAAGAGQAAAAAVTHQINFEPPPFKRKKSVPSLKKKRMSTVKRIVPEQPLTTAAAVSKPAKKFKPPSGFGSYALDSGGGSQAKVKLPPKEWDGQAAQERAKKRRRESQAQKRGERGSGSAGENTNTFSMVSQVGGDGLSSSSAIVICDADYRTPMPPVSLLHPTVVVADEFIKKYAPSSTSWLIGQEAAVAEMNEWFADFTARRRDTPRCLLLVGPSGTGKTTAARLAFTEHGMKVLRVFH